MLTQTNRIRTSHPRRPSKRIALAAGMTLALALLPHGQQAMAASNDRVSVLTAQVPAVPGPKRTIAVGQIDVLGSYANGSINVGGAIAGMLSTALDESGRFTVVERQALSSVMSERTLAESGVTGAAAPARGEVLPASYVITGSISNITQPGQNSGGGISFGGRNLFSLGGGGGNVTIDLRVVDARTGSVVRAFSVKRKLTGLNFGFNGSIGGLPVATNQWFNSDLGSATRKAINDAVVIIAQSLASQPWQGQVVEAEDGQVYVNAGAEAGLAPGTRLAILRPGRVFTDPASGAVLSRQMTTVGEVTIASVESKMAYGAYTGSGAPLRGDLVQLMR